MTTSSDRPTARSRNWGRWGDDDERGALNLLQPETILRAKDAITSGVVYGLGVPIHPTQVPTIDYRGTPMRLTLMDGTDHGSLAPGFGVAEGTGANEDVLVLAAHTATHMDALVHVYGEFTHYNGVPSDTMQAMAGARRLGIEKVGGFAARAVLLDLVALLADGQDWVTPGHIITGEQLQEAATAQGVEVRAGDVVLVRTGYLRYWRETQPGHGEFAQPGIGLDAAQWLIDRDVVAVGADNAAVEAIPFDDGDFLGVHKRLLVDSGIYLIEFMDLDAPARDGNHEGLLSIGSLKVPGATGSPLNPIFIT